MTRIGIPYAHTNPDGTRTCPVCGESIPERHDADGEALTNNYGLHYADAHADLVPGEDALEMARRLPDTDPLPVLPLGDCEAQVDEPPHYFHTHQCSRRAATDRHGMPLCGQHARQVDRRGAHLIDAWKRGAR